MVYRTYSVEITTWDGTSEMDFVAEDANGAKKQARAYMRDVCGHDRHCGKASYRARSQRDG